MTIRPLRVLAPRRAVLSDIMEKQLVTARATDDREKVAQDLTRYDLEYDLRTMMFEHLTRLSASFYDKVQTGQLISRANSDIRAVQMFLAFAPNISVRFVGFAVAFGIMLTISIPLTFIAIGTLPLVYLTGALVLGLVFLATALDFSRRHSPRQARLVLRASLAYLPGLFALLLADRALPWLLGL